MVSDTVFVKQKRLRSASVLLSESVTNSNLDLNIKSPTDKQLKVAVCRTRGHCDCDVMSCGLGASVLITDKDKTPARLCRVFVKQAYPYFNYTKSVVVTLSFQAILSDSVKCSLTEIRWVVLLNFERTVSIQV